MKQENTSFKEALEILADKAGITLPKKSKPIYITKNSDPNNPQNQSYNNTDLQPEHETTEITRKQLLNATDWLAKIYNDALQNHHESEPVKKYLKDRGIDNNEIKKFQIGYAPYEQNWLVNKVNANQEKLQILEIVGNLINADKSYDQQDNVAQNTPNNLPKQLNNSFNNTRYYDRFRGRLMFPIRDTQNRTIAFGGRVIPDGLQKSKAKYINSPETPLFSKHHTLYGLDIAKLKMKETRRAIIMEGYTDCIIAHKFGFGDSVAVLGTALGSEHIKILKRYVDKMILVLDGDEAGRKRADQVMELFVAQGVDMSILTLPNNSDPCEFLLEHGADAFELLLKTESVNVLEHAFQSLTKGIDLQNDIVASTNALDTILTIIAQSPTNSSTPDDPIRIRIEKTLQNLAHRFNVTERLIWDRFREKQNRAKDKKYNSSAVNLPVENLSDVAESEWELENQNDAAMWNSAELLPDHLERAMLELWLSDATSIYEFWESVPIDRCRSPITVAIYKKCNELIDRDRLVNFGNLIVAFDSPRMKNYLDEVAAEGEQKLFAMQMSKGKIDPNYQANTDTDGNLDELNEIVQNTEQHELAKEKFDPELRAKLIREIIEGFDRRDAERNRMIDENQLRGNSLSEEEKERKLIQVREALRQKQEDKRKRFEFGN
jgi:DNA primase